jgi:hypothetical protein
MATRQFRPYPYQKEKTPVHSLTRIVPATMLAAAIVLSAAACSSSGGVTSLSGTPDQIVQKAVNDLKAATSLQISGNVVSSGSNIKIDLTDVAAAGCKGTITLAASSSSGSALSGTADLIEVNNIVYMKLDQSFFENLSLPSSLFSGVAGKYIKVTSKSELADLAQLCDASTLASGFDNEDTGFVKDGTATVNGQPTEAFKQPTHSGSGIVYISQSSTPEIVRLQGPSNQGQVNFTNYNAPATITAPAASDVIDGSKFGL